MVWPNFFLMNVFFALKGSKLFIIIESYVKSKFMNEKYISKLKMHVIGFGKVVLFVSFLMADN